MFSLVLTTFQSGAVNLSFVFWNRALYLKACGFSLVHRSWPVSRKDSLFTGTHYGLCTQELQKELAEQWGRRCGFSTWVIRDAHRLGRQILV